MSAPKIQVRCSVENCKFNEQKMCYASSLEVNATGDRNANSSEGTCCETFINGK